MPKIYKKRPKVFYRATVGLSESTNVPTLAPVMTASRKKLALSSEASTSSQPSMLTTEDDAHFGQSDSDYRLGMSPLIIWWRQQWTWQTNCKSLFYVKWQWWYSTWGWSRLRHFSSAWDMSATQAHSNTLVKWMTKGSSGLKWRTKRQWNGRGERWRLTECLWWSDKWQKRVSPMVLGLLTDYWSRFSIHLLLRVLFTLWKWGGIQG